MRIIGLDLSTKTGWAVLDDSVLQTYGLVTVETRSFSLPYPSNLCAAAQSMGSSLIDTIRPFIDGARHAGRVVEVVIEDTNLGPDSQRYAQKILEFIHCQVVGVLLKEGIVPRYVDSMVWRKHSGALMDPAHREHNASLIAAKEKEIEAAEVRVQEIVDRKYAPKIAGCTSKKVLREILRDMKSERKQLIADATKSIRAPAGKITYKHLSVHRANQLFGINLSLAENDIADAICIAYSRFAGNIVSKERQP